MTTTRPAQWGRRISTNAKHPRGNIRATWKSEQGGQTVWAKSYDYSSECFKDMDGPVPPMNVTIF